MFVYFFNIIYFHLEQELGQAVKAQLKMRLRIIWVDIKPDSKLLLLLLPYMRSLMCTLLQILLFGMAFLLGQLGDKSFMLCILLVINIMRGYSSNTL